MKIIESTKHGITRVQLLKKIMEQVEFYFSDDNLATDVFLLKQMYKKNNEEHQHLDTTTAVGKTLHEDANTNIKLVRDLWG